VGKKQHSLIGWLNLGSAAGDRSIRRVIPALNLNTITKISLEFAILRNCVHQRNHQTRFTLFGPIDVLIAFVGRMDGTIILPGSRQEQHYPADDLLMVRMSGYLPRICVQRCAHLRRDADAQLHG
jgi:hypothetical protein